MLDSLCIVNLQSLISDMRSLPASVDRISNTYTVHHITEAQGGCIYILSALQLILFSENVNTVGTQHWLYPVPVLGLFFDTGSRH